MNLNCLTGNTPLVQISDNVYGKLETYNPTGSVKDRMVFYVIEDALKRGLINQQTILCEATSGNTGISLSSIAANLGMKCVIFMPENMSEERKKMMRVFGSRLFFSGPSDFAGAIQMRDEFIEMNPNCWSPMQFSNPINVECHENVTAPEIHAQVGDDWVAFVHGAGTGGTMMGVKNYIDSHDLNVDTYLVAPKEELHGIQGINDGADFLLDREKMTGIIEIATDDAIERAKSFAKETGVLVGISSGANILASEHLSSRVDNKKVIVTMLCDRGERYMSIY